METGDCTLYINDWGLGWTSVFNKSGFLFCFAGPVMNIITGCVQNGVGGERRERGVVCLSRSGYVIRVSSVIMKATYPSSFLCSIDCTLYNASSSIDFYVLIICVKYIFLLLFL